MANMKAEEAGPAEVDLDNDYVAQLFNKIDWNSRIRPETHRDPHRYMYVYWAASVMWIILGRLSDVDPDPWIQVFWS